MSTSSLSLIPRIHTELSIIISDRAENRPSTLVWEIRERLWSEVFERKSRLFYNHNIFRIKIYSFIASRIEKNTWSIVKITFSCGNYHIFRLFFLLTWVAGTGTTFADQGPSKTVAFFRIPNKLFMSGTWNFRIIERNIKSIFREYFSSLPFDSGEICK